MSFLEQTYRTDLVKASTPDFEKLQKNEATVLPLHPSSTFAGEASEGREHRIRQGLEVVVEREEISPLGGFWGGLCLEGKTPGVFLGKQKSIHRCD